MKKDEYLRLAIEHKLYNSLIWLITAFSFAISKEKDSYREYELLRIDGKYMTWDPVVAKLVSIENKPDTVLYGFKDIITIDSTWLVNNTKTIKTYIGNLIANAVLLTDNFKDKIPYINKEISIRDIEDIVAKRLSKDDTPGTITVKEYTDFVDSTFYYEGISKITVISATENNVLPPKGIEKKLSELLVKYKGKLDDPIAATNLENELRAFDKEFLQGDPSLGKFASGKVLNLARKKLYLTYGAEFGFGTNDKLTFIKEPLVKGWSKKPEDIVALYNSSRFGSYSRGVETMEGGLSAKIALRASNVLTVVEGDCGTTLGLSMMPTASNYNIIVGRYLLRSNKPVEIENEAMAKGLIGSNVLLRSPLYCKEEGQKFCSICAGKKLSIHKKGISLAVTEVTGELLYTSMKAMHGKVLDTNELKLDEAFN